LVVMHKHCQARYSVSTWEQSKERRVS